MGQPTAKDVMELVEGSTCVGGNILAVVDGKNIVVARLTPEGVSLTTQMTELWELNEDSKKAKLAPKAKPAAKAKPAPKK